MVEEDGYSFSQIFVCQKPPSGSSGSPQGRATEPKDHTLKGCYLELRQGDTGNCVCVAIVCLEFNLLECFLFLCTGRLGGLQLLLWWEIWAHSPRPPQARQQFCRGRLFACFWVCVKPTLFSQLVSPFNAILTKGYLATNQACVSQLSL